MIIFLYGEDTYRSRQKIYEITEHYKKTNPSGLSFTFLDMEEKGFEDFREAVGVVSMFGEKKLVILKNLSQRPSEGERLCNYIKNTALKDSRDTVVVFWESVIPPQRKALFEDLRGMAPTQEFKKLEGYRLEKWISKEVEKQGARIESQAVRKLAAFVGSDLWQMSNEISKLVSFCYSKRVIVSGDVDLLVKSKINTNIFDTVDALGRKDKKTALRSLHQHLEKGENEIYLLSMFVYQFRNLIKIRDLLDQNAPSYLIGKKTRLHPYVVQKSLGQVRNFTFSDLKKIYQKLLDTDLAVKTGRMRPGTALESFIYSLC